MTRSASRRAAGPAALTALLAALALLAATGLAPRHAEAQGYQIGAGDQLRVEVLEDETLTRSVLVAPDGRISFPLAGTVSARGRTLAALQSDLTDLLAPNFADRPNVVVSLERLAAPPPFLPPEAVVPPTVAIYAIGEVANSGRLEVEPGTRLLQALAQIGGLSPFAAEKRLQLRRFDHHLGRERIYPLNYRAIVSGRSPNGGVVMQEGDVIFAPTRRLFE